MGWSTPQAGYTPPTRYEHSLGGIHRCTFQNTPTDMDTFSLSGSAPKLPSSVIPLWGTVGVAVQEWAKQTWEFQIITNFTKKGKHQSCSSCRVKILPVHHVKTQKNPTINVLLYITAAWLRNLMEEPTAGVLLFVTIVWLRNPMEDPMASVLLYADVNWLRRSVC